MPTCLCGCKEETGGGRFCQGHDQRLRARLELEVGGLMNLAVLVFAAKKYANEEILGKEYKSITRSIFHGIAKPEEEIQSIPAETAPYFDCPINGCHFRFHNTRGGWDGHVGAFGIHPLWHPETRDPEKRRVLFREEFGSWLE